METLWPLLTLLSVSREADCQSSFTEAVETKELTELSQVDVCVGGSTMTKVTDGGDGGVGLMDVSVMTVVDTAATVVCVGGRRLTEEQTDGGDGGDR